MCPSCQLPNISLPTAHHFTPDDYPMTTRLDKTIKREITARGEILILTLGPKTVILTPKGRRKGKTFIWADLWSGEAELTEQLRVSVAALAPSIETPANRRVKRGRRARRD